MPVENFIIRQISFCPATALSEQTNSVLITGRDVFLYYVLSGNNLKCVHKKFKDETVRDITCHAWLADGKFIVCTREGTIH